jgi:hypothetical protein
MGGLRCSDHLLLLAGRPRGLWLPRAVDMRSDQVKKHVPVSRRTSGRAPRSRRIVLMSLGPPWLHFTSCPVTVSEKPPGEQDSPGAVGQPQKNSQNERCSHSAMPICACTCESRSGGPVSEPDGLTRTRVLPPAAPAGAGIQSRRACPSGAVQRAGIHTWPPAQ